MRDDNTKFYLAVIFLCLSGGVFLFMSLNGCTRPPSVPKAKNKYEQLDRAVTVQVNCLNTAGWGSGVVITKRLILTAGHVVNRCRHPFTIGVLANGDEVALKVRVVSKVQDAAVLEADEDLHFNPVKMGRVKVGDAVCIAPAQPHRVYTCGHVEDIFEGLRKFNILFDMTAVQGNSGSGIYNDSGELVGIVTHMVFRGGGAGTAIWLVQEELGI